MSINVLYVASSGLSAPIGGGWVRMISEAKQAKKHDFSTAILCFFPPRHALFKLRFVCSAKVKMEQEAGCKVFFIPRLPLTRIPWIHRLNDWYCGLIVFMLCWWYGIRIVHGQGVNPTLFAFVARKMKSDIKVVADVHGASMEEYMYGRNLAQKDEFARAIEKSEISVLREADWIIFVSKAMQKYYEGKYGTDFKKSCIIPCATESTFTVDNSRKDALRREYGLSGKMVFCYVGSAENYQLPEKMCWLFRKILDRFPNSFLLIFSHYREFASHLEAASIASSCYRVLSVEHEQIFDLLQMGDIGFLLRDESIINRVASPTKFAEYCLCGLPVITTDHVGDISEMVRQYKLGCIVDLRNLTVDSNLAAFINEVQEKRLECAERCSLFAKEHFSWKVYGNLLTSIYSSLSE